MWGDAKFRALSAAPPNGQTLWLRLLTGPEVGIIPGAFAAREAGLADALGWDLEGFREAFREAFREGLARADWEAGFVLVPNVIKHNPPVSPNVILSWRDTWDELPECDLKHEAWRILKAWAKASGKPWEKAFGKACAKPSGKASPNQEQEQEQDQDQEQEGLDPRNSSDPANPTGGVDPRAPARAHASQLELEIQDTEPGSAKLEPKPKRESKPKAKRKPARRTKRDGETPVQIAWRVWRELYERAYAAPYVDAPADGRVMTELASAAESHAKAHQDHSPGDIEGIRERVERLCRHWFASYLDDDGRKGFLAGERHPLRMAGRDLPRYGLPWGRGAISTPPRGGCLPKGEKRADEPAGGQQTAGELSPRYQEAEKMLAAIGGSS